MDGSLGQASPDASRGMFEKGNLRSGKPPHLERRYSRQMFLANSCSFCSAGDEAGRARVLVSLCASCKVRGSKARNDAHRSMPRACASSNCNDAVYCRIWRHPCTLVPSGEVFLVKDNRPEMAGSGWSAVLIEFVSSDWWKILMNKFSYSLRWTFSSLKNERLFNNRSNWILDVFVDVFVIIGYITVLYHIGDFFF